MENTGTSSASGQTGQPGSYGPAFEHANRARTAAQEAESNRAKGDNLGYVKMKAEEAGHRLMEAMSSGKDESTRSSLTTTLNSWKTQLENEVKQFNASRQGAGLGTTGQTTSKTTTTTTQSSNLP